MKKLMILASVAAIAGLANAGAYTWGFNNYEITDPSGEQYTGMHSAYLLSGVVGQKDNGDGTFALDFGTLEIVASALMDGDDFNYGAFSYDATRTSDLIPAVTPGETGDKYTLLLLDNMATILDIDALADYEGSYVIKDVDALGKTDSAENKWTQIAYTDAIGQGDWRTASAVPEPTSGLLLLLGVAGLALRRRRA